MKCIRCGNEMTDTDGIRLFCPSCEATFNEQPTMVHNFQHGGLMAGWMCPKCGRILSPWTTFCPFCAPETTYVTTTIETINNIELVNENRGDCDE